MKKNTSRLIVTITELIIIVVVHVKKIYFVLVQAKRR